MDAHLVQIFHLVMVETDSLVAMWVLAVGEGLRFEVR